MSDRPAVGDTIVAPATPAGEGRRAVVRLSGPRAVALVRQLLGDPPVPPRGHLGEARLLLQEGAPVPLTWFVFGGPRSLTGEDLVELHLPGWPVLVTEVVRRLVDAGARPAAPGEFTRRALVHGRLDLDQALAVGRLASTADEQAAADAARTLGGALGRLAGELETALLDLAALVEAHVDFDEEDTEAIDRDTLVAGLERARRLARTLVEGAAASVPADGLTELVLLGPPNAGKSTLFMALAPDEQVATSPLPGTTRDALCALVARDGRRWRLWDGPGVGALDDPLDAEAGERFLDRLPEAAVVLHCQPVDRPGDDPHAARRRAAAAGRPLLELRTKADRLDPARPPPAGTLLVGARDGQGLPALWRAIRDAAPSPAAPDLLLRAEAEAARDLLPLLDEAAGLPSLEPALPELAEQLRQACQRLWRDRDQGRTLPDELLDRIFSSFCIGK